MLESVKKPRIGVAAVLDATASSAEIVGGLDQFDTRSQEDPVGTELTGSVGKPHTSGSDDASAGNGPLVLQMRMAVYNYALVNIGGRCFNAVGVGSWSQKLDVAARAPVAQPHVAKLGDVSDEARRPTANGRHAFDAVAIQDPPSGEPIVVCSTFGELNDSSLAVAGEEVGRNGQLSATLEHGLRLRAWGQTAKEGDSVRGREVVGGDDGVQGGDVGVHVC
jgi:hypothetical protein